MPGTILPTAHIITNNNKISTGLVVLFLLFLEEEIESQRDANDLKSHSCEVNMAEDSNA